jgi:beta-galactosidase/beta-glucuronidase
MPAVPGLNSRITDSVTLRIIGPVSIFDPWIRVDLTKNDLALINASTTVSNTSTSTVQGRCRAIIQPGNIIVTSALFSLPAGSNKDIDFLAKDFKQLKVKNPKLWWPNGYGGKIDGTQHLYSCKIYFESGKQQSDIITKKFGIRRISYDTTTLKGP